MVDWQCRESEGKAKIEGYMSVSDEEAHHRYTHSPELKMQHMPHQPPTMSLQNQSQHHQRNQKYHLEQPLRSMTPKWLPPFMHIQWIPRSPSHSANSFHCHRRSGIKYTKLLATDALSGLGHHQPQSSKTYLMFSRTLK